MLASARNGSWDSSVKYRMFDRTTIVRFALPLCLRHGFDIMFVGLSRIRAAPLDAERNHLYDITLRKHPEPVLRDGPDVS